MAPVITALYGALNAIFNIFLANNVSNARRKHRVSIGEGDHPAMLVAIRAHGNNAEFVPLAILMMLIAELCGANSVVLHAYGGGLLAARVLHWVGMPRKAPNVFRFVGVAFTWTAIVAISGYVLYLRFQLVG
ncbi:MAG: MAPEG family protein [Myxococcales bacterium]|nr:MAPEG family protein [Myxococcales bacterium]